MPGTNGTRGVLGRSSKGQWALRDNTVVGLCLRMCRMWAEGTGAHERLAVEWRLVLLCKPCHLLLQLLLVLLRYITLQQGGDVRRRLDPAQ